MSANDICLFSLSNVDDLLSQQHAVAQEVIYYCESRFRAILAAYNQADDRKKQWMIDMIEHELVGYLIWPNVVLIVFKLFAMRYVGLCSATGFPLEIPILMRSLVASISKGRPSKKDKPMGLDLTLLTVLDAGTRPGDPSALVSKYKHDWWLRTECPSTEAIFWAGTLRECIMFHREYVKPIEPATSFEKLEYTWRNIPAAGNECNDCPKFRSIAFTACEQIQMLRQQVDAFETIFDMERELSNRRAAGFHALYESAVVKETAANAEPYDAETGLSTPAPPKPEVAGTIRRPKKGPVVVKRVQAQATQDLHAFQSRPNMKWTWGADLEVDDLKDMAGAVYNNLQHLSHSGYDTDLADGTLTGVGTPAPTPPGKQWRNEPLSTDIMDVPPLPEEKIPDIFNYYPLARRRDAPAELVDDLERQYSRQKRHGREKMQAHHVVARPRTPDLAITSFRVPTPPYARHTPSAASGVEISDEAEATVPGQRGPSETRLLAAQNKMDITLSVNPDDPMFDILYESVPCLVITGLYSPSAFSVSVRSCSPVW